MTQSVGYGTRHTGRALVRRSLAAAVVLSLLAAALMLLATPGRSEAQQRPPVKFPPAPVRGDCRFYPGQECTWDAWTGEVTVSPKIIREGETIDVSVVIFNGAVS